MLKSIKDILFSTKLTALLLLVFAVAIGSATIIENDFGSQASKSLIFNAKWFELILILLPINLVGNIFKYKMYRLKKLPIFLFHIAFIVVIIGAGITRYISYEGSMRIREGQTTNLIISGNTFLNVKVDDGKIQYNFSKKLFLNPLYNKHFSHQFNFKDTPVKIAYQSFMPNAIDSVVKDENGKAIIEIVTVGNSGRVSKFIEEGKTVYFGGYPVTFNDTTNQEAIKIFTTDSGLYINSPYDINYMSMDDKSQNTILKDTIQPFKNRRLYSLDNVQMVYKTFYKHGKIVKVSAPSKSKGKMQASIGEDALTIDVSCGKETKKITLYGGKGYVSNPTMVQIGGLNFSLSYGSQYYETPFSLKLNKFILDKYPGSMSPSSFASEVTLIDNRNGGYQHNQRIYMNHVLDYDGYRFFQSSYDQDEKGTILSVNHDFWGTTVTYIGYFFLFSAMIVTLAFKSSRFQMLRQNIKKLRMKRTKLGVLLAFFILGTFTLKAQNTPQENVNNYQPINKEHANKFAHLLVQDQGGRIKPIQTLASELLRKIARKETYNGQTPTQVLLGMMSYPQYWQTQPMIKVRNPELEKELGAKDHHITFTSLFNSKFDYLLGDKVKAANMKKPSEQSKYDKEILKVDERANICFMIFQNALLKIFPNPKDKNNTWFTFNDYKKFDAKDTIFVKSIIPYYLMSVVNAEKSNNWSAADSTLKFISNFQTKYGKNIIPSPTKVNMEITYNKLFIFKRLFIYYSIVGLFLLIFIFIEIFNTTKWVNAVIKIFTAVLFVLFLAHTGGLIMRWYIAGHAPWSNGYESMIYIAWATLLAGFLFSKTSKMTLAATAILSSLILMVAHLNWLDPEITPLVPVLKSYWLMVHVAVITASYGFLGLGALLGFMNLILMILKSTKNKVKVDATIKELTYITEMTLTVGLFMATIGTFLGGIWANESWGRYWGWDPKETWALVIVLIYAMVLHLRFIPKLNGKYTFNLMAVISFSTVLMTYFGVNYYLSGLHSYAQGDPVPIPTFVPITALIIFIIAAVAYFKNKQYK